MIYKNHKLVACVIAVVLITIGIYIFIRPRSSDLPESNPTELFSDFNTINQNIIGEWQSIDDPKFVRVFSKDGYCSDVYDGNIESKDSCKFYKGKDAKNIVSNPEDDVVYLRIGDSSNGLSFEVINLTPTELSLIYLERGNILSFKKVK